MISRLLASTYLFLIAVVTSGVSVAETVKISGAGATFPFPIYAQWAYKYKNLTRTEINYQSIGSGGGIAQIKAKTVQFGASDAPLKLEELDKHGLLQFPMVMGGVVPVINLKGITKGQLRLSGPVLARIFLGEITRWNNPAIQGLNPDLKLPNQSIIVVHRADGSGTTWIFTNYLMKVSKTWKEKVGFSKSVDWPAGVGGKGNEGVAAYVKRVKGAIGYVEFAYALQSKMNYARLQNQEGKFVAPTIETFQAAATHGLWEESKGYYLVLTNQPGKESWPITGASFILIYKDQADSGLAKAMLAYFDWCYHHGRDAAKSLHYVPVPANVVEMVQSTWQKQIRSAGSPVWEVSTQR